MRTTTTVTTCDACGEIYRSGKTSGLVLVALDASVMETREDGRFTKVFEGPLDMCGACFAEMFLPVIKRAVNSRSNSHAKLD